MSDTVTVTVAQGGLRGKRVTLSNGKIFFSFQGIPYAKPPVGPLRFKAPEPAEPWTGIRDALVEGSVAPQIDEFKTNQYVGEEDCLFLNVYTPKVQKPLPHFFQLPDSKGNTHPLPVMVFIHGGGFYLGSGNSDFYGPDYLMTEDVILVTMNYRLGALGFLSTSDDVIPGNNGLKDQALALRWVQQNITNFGGNPNNVTIFGESAGGASVHHHLLSPMSEGLFHKAILQSGTALCPWAFVDAPTARTRAFRFGAALGCNANSSKELLDFLSKVPTKQLVDDVQKALSLEEKLPLPLFFQPVEEVADHTEKFLTGKPKELISAGIFHKVPMIVGVTTQEGMFTIKNVKENMAWYEGLNKHFESILPQNLNLERGTDKSKQLAEKVKKFYFGDKPISMDTLLHFSEYYSDFWFVAGTNESIKKQLMKSSESIYLYLFSYEGNMGFVSLWLGGAKLEGVCHGDELSYLFQMFFNKDKNVDPESDDMKMMKRMVKMWTNFAKTGNPTPVPDPLLQNVTWPPATASAPNKHLDIGSELKVGHTIFPERVAFWENIYESAQ